MWRVNCERNFEVKTHLSMQFKYINIKEFMRLIFAIKKKRDKLNFNFVKKTLNSSGF